MFRICPAVGFKFIYKTNRIFCSGFFQKFFFSFPSLAAVLVSLWLLSLCLPLISCFLSYVAFGITKDRLSSFPLKERHQLFSTDLCSSGWCLLGFLIEKSSLPQPSLFLFSNYSVSDLCFCSTHNPSMGLGDRWASGKRLCGWWWHKICSVFCFPGLKVKRWWSRSNNLFLSPTSRKEQEVVPVFHWHSPYVYTEESSLSCPGKSVLCALGKVFEAIL